MTFKPTKEQWKNIDDAERVLSRYKHHLYQSRHSPSIGSPKFDGMPTSPSFSNHTEDEIIDHVDDPNRAYCEYCKAIVDDMKDESFEYAGMLKMLYFGWNTRFDVQKKFELTRNPYYDDLKRAKIIFGKSCNMKLINRWERESKQIKYDT